LPSSAVPGPSVSDFLVCSPTFPYMFANVRNAAHVTLPPALHRKRVTLHKPPLAEAAQQAYRHPPVRKREDGRLLSAAEEEENERRLRAEFRLANELDYRLYAAAQKRFAEQLRELGIEAEGGTGGVTSCEGVEGDGADGATSIIGDRYDYLLKFSKRNSIAATFAPDDGHGMKGIEAAVAAADAVRVLVHSNPR
jgi:hypothetical protein